MKIPAPVGWRAYLIIACLFAYRLNPGMLYPRVFYAGLHYPFVFDARLLNPVLLNTLLVYACLFNPLWIENCLALAGLLCNQNCLSLVNARPLLGVCFHGHAHHPDEDCR
jgi:hypothetical protein